MKSPFSLVNSPFSPFSLGKITSFVAMSLRGGARCESCGGARGGWRSWRSGDGEWRGRDGGTPLHYTFTRTYIDRYVYI